MSIARPTPTRTPRGQSRRASGACALAVLASLFGCNPRVDIVASRTLIRDAHVDSGPPPCDSSDCRDAAIVDAGFDAGFDAGCDSDVRDCGVPPVMPGDCSAQSCNSLASRAAFCASAQPTSVVLGDTCNATGHQQFKFAICACRGLVTSAGFEVDSLNPGAAPGGASIASNDQIRLGTDTTVDGTIYVSGMYGALAMPVATKGVVQDADPACSCDPARFLDVGALVSTRAFDNDNAAAQLTPASLDGFSTGASLSLDCGRYYFSHVVGGGLLQIEAKGRVAIFIAGDLGLDDGFTLTLQSGATAEIYVGGNVRVGGDLELGTSNDGNRVLLVVGGTGTIDLGGDSVLDGSIYAPREELVTRGTLELNGSLFVSRANFEKATRVHFAPLPAAREMCAR